MILLILCALTIFQATTGAPYEEPLLLKKRDLEGSSLSLSDFISSVEDSLIQTAYSAGQGSNKLRNQRQTNSDDKDKKPKTQLSIITIKLNPVSQSDSKDANKEIKDNKGLKENVKEDIKDKTENHSVTLKDKSKESLNQNSSEESIEKQTESKTKETKQENYKVQKLEKQKQRIENKVAEIEVNPVILASRV